MVLVSQQNPSKMINVDESTIDFPQNYKIYKTVSDVTMRVF